MSRQYEYERTTRRTAASLAGPRRAGLGHWLPLGLTVLVATVGIAAWIWSERQDDDEEAGGDGGRRAGYEGDNVYTAPAEDSAHGAAARTEESSSYMARMSGALRRTPSPQQFIDGASRNIAAGVAAAGAVVGSALSSIREEDKNAYKDHKTWAEEAELRGTAMDTAPETKSSPAQPVGRRKTVAIVVSADSTLGGIDDEEDYHHEHASILSHLPTNTDLSKVRLFILIYAPGLKEHPLDAQYSKPGGSLSSSFSNIMTPGEELDKSLSLSTAAATPAFTAIYSQAQLLTEKSTMILPFTTPTGHTHILRHLSPDYVYLQESLSGTDGENITKLQTWLRQDVVLVVGADGGHGGLADSESEAEQQQQQAKKSQHWWEKEERVGRGRGVVVVEGTRVGDDWARRIEGKE